ncbi:DUF4124 domain-containing protein [Acinetobacter sp. S40]|uniref:DUF4124 domain-containing protein n=1 Tax=unclassified Acinetobacter TaxID=196816 RepID=UPI00190DF58F|nr:MULTISPECIES: DUF4124 domain-containing protein [unclassified Acinetobacter]MBJ9986798.1 DUF4124 domain-containing protein [Acinetobacter sp. S40]MBK0065161.1 DUF4124 domain-containing protein [Acinetobacter sp. S55]MBK0068302.1 DUF4124 domain-containing protein [Acinetobacter sp. S54]
MNQQVSYRRKVYFLAQSVVMATLMLFATQNHAEQYYKWVDSKGSTHYTATPPPKGSKKQGQVNTYGHTPRPTQNNESNHQQTQPNTENGNKNQPATPAVNTPQITPKPEQSAPSVAPRTNQATY